ncbi:hypothetical protein EDD66_10787 [Mobilisporobacter senegalensis]|uniref:ABC-2 family transporter n=1 Tax=Mobilisporobacter senegalensis TaxID=1329262 RepID=A0A3N1XKE9_9FIRM|nr:hypothetical protein [Mobilisporobacter senegalensis]ROR27173.1 hypothetical protein EDD66_10787 [Mobilisporobacter senegalensis]
MIKLMKYELRKQAFSKGIILAILALLEIVFLFGILSSNEKVLGLSIGFLLLITYASILYVAFENIITYSNDLNSKRSYMLFLTPRSSYQIVGAKVLTAGIQVLVTGFAFLLVGIADIGIVIAKYDMLAEIRDMIVTTAEQIIKANVDTKTVLLIFLLLLLSWISIMTIGFFSITLSTTFLANKKFKGVVSFAIFLVINFLYSFITEKTIGGNFSETYIIMNCLYTSCFIAITYFGTAWMLDKKVCV